MAWVLATANAPSTPAAVAITLGDGGKAESSGAGSLVLHPLAWEGVELALASSNAIEHLSLPYDPTTRRLFGVPVVATASQTAGVGHVLGTGAVVVDTDTLGVGVQWSVNSNADDFFKNLIPARCEGRFNIGAESAGVW